MMRPIFRILSSVLAIVCIVMSILIISLLTDSIEVRNELMDEVSFVATGNDNASGDYEKNNDEIAKEIFNAIEKVEHTILAFFLQVLFFITISIFFVFLALKGRAPLFLKHLNRKLNF